MRYLIVIVCSIFSLFTGFQVKSQNLDSLIINKLLKNSRLPISTYEDDVNNQKILHVVGLYIKNSNDRVRYRSYRLTLDVSIRSDQRNIKSKALDILLNSATDNEHYIRKRFHDSFMQFDRSLFNDQFKENVKKYLHDDRTINRSHVLLAGYFGMTEEKEYLKNHIINSDKQFNNEFGRSYFNSIKFAAHLALARMGEKEHIDFVLDKAKKADPARFAISHLGLISYVKQQEAIDLLVYFLNSDERFDPEEKGFREMYANKAIHHLAISLKDFPVKRNIAQFYSRADIDAARNWANKNKTTMAINREAW